MLHCKRAVYIVVLDEHVFTQYVVLGEQYDLSASVKFTAIQ